MRSSSSWAFTASAALAVSLASASALAADPPCNDLTSAGEDANVPAIYIESGDTQTPMLQRLGIELMASSTPLRLIFRERPTCNLAGDLYQSKTMYTVSDTNGAKVTARQVRYIPKGFVYKLGAKPPVCTVPDPITTPGADPNPPGAAPIQLGIGATYLSSCSLPANTAGVTVINGPVQAYGFITNPLSNQRAITGEEGYLAFGFPAGGGDAAPWVLQDLRFTRGNSASTMLTMAAAIRLLPSQMMRNNDSSIPDTSDAIVAQIKAATTTPDASIGTLGMDLYDVHRDEVKLLAFKTFGQRFAYFPDSSSSSFDKVNVRDGHYAPWSPTPYMSKATNGKDFDDASARRVFELVMGLRSPSLGNDDVDGLKAIVQSSLVPECAMKVTRAGDGADFTLYSDPSPCGCYFEANVSGGTTSCSTCTQDAQCGTGHCRYGYCEVK